MRECGLGACTADFAEFVEGLVAWKHALFHSLPNSFAIFCNHLQTCAERMMQPSQLLQHFLQNTKQKCTEDDDGHESVELC
jgi:hypothetical protein